MVIAGIVDQSLPQGDQGHLWMQIGLLLIFAVIGVLVALDNSILLSKGSSRFAKELTNDSLSSYSFLAQGQQRPSDNF